MLGRDEPTSWGDLLLATRVARTLLGVTVARKPTPAIPNDDPLWRKFFAAPVDPTPLSEQELHWLEQAKLSGVIDGASVTREIAFRAVFERATEAAE